MFASEGRYSAPYTLTQQKKNEKRRKSDKAGSRWQWRPSKHGQSLMVLCCTTDALENFASSTSPIAIVCKRAKPMSLPHDFPLRGKKSSMLSGKLVSMIVWKNRSSFGTMHPPHGKKKPAQNGCSNGPTSIAYISCARLHAVIIMCCFKRNHRVRIYPHLQSTHAISIQPQKHSKRGNLTLNNHIPLFRLHDFTIHVVLRMSRRHVDGRGTWNIATDPPIVAHCPAQQHSLPMHWPIPSPSGRLTTKKEPPYQ